MIRTRTAERAPTPPGVVFATSIPDPLVGPARAGDPVSAMARDLQDIVAARGGVEEADLLQKGWTADEVARHFGAAVRLTRARAL